MSPLVRALLVWCDGGWPALHGQLRRSRARRRTRAALAAAHATLARLEAGTAATDDVAGQLGLLVVHEPDCATRHGQAVACACDAVVTR